MNPSPPSPPAELEPAPSAVDSTERPSPPFPIVGIGASAGGLEALEALTRRLSSDGMAYVVLQHLAAGHDSLLGEILGRGTTLRVVTLREGLVLETNTIYVAPANAGVAIEQGVARILPASGQVPRHPIDAFFRSLAADRGSAAIGVILSGAGADGTVGLRAIQERGGITFVQEPSTAGQSSMPQSAIDAGAADFCLSPTEIGDELMRLSAHPFVSRARPARLFSEDTLNNILGRLRRAFGVDFAAYKLTTIERRIVRRMALQKLEKPEDYLKFLDTKADELAVLYGDLLIGVTGFFRDKDPFDVLKSAVFPRLFEKRSTDRPIRFWVAGCATGEEAYSVAICLLEYLGDRVAGYKIQIFATDIDDSALDVARQALYPERIEIDVSPERLQRFFSKQEKGYRLIRQVRDLVVFAHHNLGKDPPFSRLDLICCRNVLIYMQSPLQRKVLRVFHYALNQEAFLLLGTSESVGDAADLFAVVDNRQKIYSKKSAPSGAVFDLAFGPRLDAEPRAALGPAALGDHRPTISVQQLADRKVIERYGPPAVLLNESLEVMQFRGQTGPFLSPAPGAATFNVFKLARPELIVPLRTCVQQALAENLAVVSSPIHLWDGRDVAVTLDVMPLPDSGSKRTCLLVSFRVAPPPEAAAEPGPIAPPIGPQNARIEALELELLTTKEYLQTTIEELEGANEELQSSNEELQSSNEELQSSNEELETSKEELQSTNEELATVNEELQNRMGQLGVSNDDLQNLLGSVHVPVIIVGMDLRIRRFSAAAERLLNLITADVGRPVAYLGGAVNAPQIEQIVSDTINTVTLKELRVRCTDGNWYTMRVVPYRTIDHSIRGAVIELVRAPLTRKIGEPVEVNEFVGKVLSTIPHALVLLDGQLRLLWVNKRFFDAFRVGAEVLGRSLDEVWTGRERHPELFALLEGTVAGGPTFERRVDHLFGQSDERPMKVSAQCIPAENDRPALTLLILEEVTAP